MQFRQKLCVARKEIDQQSGVATHQPAINTTKRRNITATKSFGTRRAVVKFEYHDSIPTDLKFTKNAIRTIRSWGVTDRPKQAHVLPETTIPKRAKVL